MKASWNGTTIAESDDIVTVEGMLTSLPPR